MDDEEAQKNKRLEKKRRLKERFDAEYDDGGDATYFDDLKEEMQKQAEVQEVQQAERLPAGGASPSRRLPVSDASLSLLSLLS